MPGIAGAVAVAPSLTRQVVAGFRAIWPDASVHSGTGYALAGHAHEGAAVWGARDGGLVAVDGEWSLYRTAREALPDEEERLFLRSRTGLELSAACTGNVALIEPGAAVFLAAEWSGSFPLYYAQVGGGLVFSSQLRVLREALDAGIDDQGVVEFLREAHMFGTRTLATGIHRVLPGQSVTHRAGGLTVREHSLAWTSAGSVPLETEPESLVNELGETVDRAVPADVPVALMMSAGWDSRTLLPLLQTSAGKLLPYCHGDVRSREFRLVDGICRSRGLDPWLEPIDERILDIHRIGRAFPKVETAVFPHWIRAGSLLGVAGAKVVAAGVYGEVLGGHYGATMLTTGTVAKALELLRAATGGSDLEASLTREDVVHLLQPRHLGVEWCLGDTFVGAPGERVDRMRQEVLEDVARLEARGVDTPHRLLEAFVAEHRGTQYITAQLLSCRAATDIAAPFAHRHALLPASRMPMAAKIHNRVNRKLLKHLAPDLLAFPLAATLAPAGAPLLVQEASRLARKIYETARWHAHWRSGGRLPRPRLGWVDFEFLRDGVALHALVEDLRMDIWDRGSIRHRIDRMQETGSRQRLHPVFDMLAKIYTVDMLLRRS